MIPVTFAPMHLQSLSLSFFRNYEALDVQFSPGLNCLAGDNGSGKTNVMEAIHFLALTRGFQGQADKFSLRDGDPFFMTLGMFQRDGRQVQIECNFQPGKGKKILVDRQPLVRMSDHLGLIPLVSILPEDTEIITGSGSVRRRFIDSFISQYDHEYLLQLIRYEKAHAQRNALLSAMLEANRFSRDELEPWTDEMVNAAMIIHSGRRNFLESFRPWFEDVFHKIVSGKETPEARLSSQVEENAFENWKSAFETRLQSDRFSGRTQTGIHKDDLVFSIDGMQVRQFGSQGQTKTFVIALKFAQYKMLEKKTGHSPILLLDDLFDKLDPSRMKGISQVLESEISGQIFLTDANPVRVKEIFGHLSSKPVSFFRVSNANLISEN